MSIYTVKAAEVTKTDVGKYNNDEVTATLANADGKEAEVTYLKKPDSPLPDVGSTVEGTVEQTQYGLRFKREWKSPGGGDDRSRHAEIALAVAVKSATALAQSFIASGNVKDESQAIGMVASMTPKLLPIVTGDNAPAEAEGKAPAPKSDTDDIPF